MDSTSKGISSAVFGLCVAFVSCGAACSNGSDQNTDCEVTYQQVRNAESQSDTVYRFGCGASDECRERNSNSVCGDAAETQIEDRVRSGETVVIDDQFPGKRRLWVVRNDASGYFITYFPPAAVENSGQSDPSEGSACERGRIDYDPIARLRGGSVELRRPDAGWRSIEEMRASSNGCESY